MIATLYQQWALTQHLGAPPAVGSDSDHMGALRTMDADFHHMGHYQQQVLTPTTWGATSNGH